MERIHARKTDPLDLFVLLPKLIAMTYVEKLTDKNSETWTFYAGEQIVAVGGVVGVPQVSMGEAWMVPGEAFYKHPHAPIIMRDVLRSIEERLGYTRYQMTTKLTNPKDQRFAEWLGYQREAVLHQYINGDDYVMYARVPGGF